jgi:hypothetical protein
MICRLPMSTPPSPRLAVQLELPSAEVTQILARRREVARAAMDVAKTAGGGGHVDAPASDGNGCTSLFHDVMLDLLLVSCFIYN